MPDVTGGGTDPDLGTGGTVTSDTDIGSMRGIICAPSFHYLTYGVRIDQEESHHGSTLILHATNL